MPNKAEILALLKGIDLFSDLTKKELGLLADCLRPLEHADGEVIVREGDTDARFFIVLAGKATATTQGKRLATFGPGQYFGEISLLDHGPRTASVTASGPVTTMSMASFVFRPLVKANPETMYKLLVKLCERVRALDKRLVG